MSERITSSMKNGLPSARRVISARVAYGRSSVSEQVLDERVALRRGQMAEADLACSACMLGTGRRQDAVRGMRRLGPRQHDEEQRVPRRQAQQRFEERDRRLVRPVQVLEHQHQSAARRARRRSSSTHVLHDQLADELAVDRRGCAQSARRSGRKPISVATNGNTSSHSASGMMPARAARSFALGVRLVVVGDAGPAPQEVDERVEA